MGAAGRVHVTLFLTCLTVALVASCAWAHTAAEWKNRTIYQVLTDRFARSDGSTSPCSNLNDYCGGTFRGLIKKLDYIASMGFDAIWISPVIANTPHGYHGYWAKDLFVINSHFGSASDLKALVAACHARDIWVMVDVVANHMGPVGYDYSTLTPFNTTASYHDCTHCPPDCNIDFSLGNQTQVELCRLAGLPDLNQTNPFVKSTLLSWIAWLKDEFGFDGMRVDTVPEIHLDFWGDFQNAADMFGIGEVYDGRVSYLAGYQGPHALDSVLSYPLYFTLTEVFVWQHSMNKIEAMLQAYQSTFRDVSVLGTFLENHDQKRFYCDQRDLMLYQNALTYTLLAQGIPIIYYGAEQGFSGCIDPENREPLWVSEYKTNGYLYKLIQLLITTRKQQGIQHLDQVQRYSDDNFYAFTRGSQLFVALTNGGSKQGQITRTITYHPFEDGTKLCNIFWGDCLVVQNGSFTVYLDHGESKVYVPAPVNTTLLK